MLVLGMLNHYHLGFKIVDKYITCRCSYKVFFMIITITVNHLPHIQKANSGRVVRDCTEYLEDSFGGIVVNRYIV